MEAERQRSLPGAAADPLLRVRDLSVVYPGPAGGQLAAVREVGFDLAAGESAGVLGESGCGKSTLCLALMGLLPPAASSAGSVLFEGRELLVLDDRKLAPLRGERLSMIFQEPGLALNPCLRVGTQVGDVLRAHRRRSRRETRAEVLALLETVRFDDPERIYRSYPHELSGGERQRVVIAQALICRPDLLVADEPTAALDATTQADLVALLLDLKRRFGMALLFVSHDPSLLGALSDRLLVMYAGRLVESGPRERLLDRPLHPYTRELLRCLPSTEPPAEGRRRPLHVVPGAPPDLASLGLGCAFEPRCPDRLETCRTRPPRPVAAAPDRLVDCVHHEPPAA